MTNDVKTTQPVSNDCVLASKDIIILSKPVYTCLKSTRFVQLIRGYIFIIITIIMTGTHSPGQCITN